MLHNMINHVLCRDSDIVSGSPAIVDEVATDDNTITDKAPEKDKPKPDEVEPGEEVKAKPEEKSPEKEQLYQTRMQNLLGYIKQIEPDRLDEFKQAAKEGVSDPITPAPDDAGGGRTIADLEVDEFVGVMTKKLTEANRASFVELGRQQTIDRERASASQALLAQAKEFGLTNDDLNKAIGEASKLSIDTNAVGGFSRLAVAAMKELKLTAFEKGIVTRTQEAVTSATDAARDIVATEQPAKGAPPTKGKETEEQKTLRRIQEVRGRPSHTLLDSELRPKS